MHSFNPRHIAVVALTFFSALSHTFIIPDDANEGDVIPGSYIVVLKEDLAPDALDTHNSWVTNSMARRLAKRDRGRGGRGWRWADGGKWGPRRPGVHSTYRFGKWKGYAGEFDDDMVKEILNRPEVAYVEPDTVVTVQAVLPKEDGLSSQSDAPWGLGRVSHKQRGSDEYVYDSSAGKGTTAYVLDTGVWVDHPEFEGRAIWGTTKYPDATDADYHGHGTHVAGTIAGKTYGIAKAASIVAVKVMSDKGSGSASSVIAGIQWAVDHAAGKKAVINMSLGGTKSNALNNAAENAIAQGMTIVAASGNQGKPANEYSPGSSENVITVGAIDEQDARAPFSNYGPEVDIYAPGNNVLSAWIGSEGATRMASGTSMACPHVAGVALYLMALEDLTTPKQVKDRLLELAQPVVSNSGEATTNVLLNNGSGR